MCGIVGIAQGHRDQAHSDGGVDQATIHRMCEAIVHRGPDDEGIYAQGPVGLGAVGDRWIAVPVAGSENAGFGEADAQLISRQGNSGAVRPLLPEKQLRQIVKRGIA